jgi:hypothetical protein
VCPLPRVYTGEGLGVGDFPRTKLPPQFPAQETPFPLWGKGRG